MLDGRVALAGFDTLEEARWLVTGVSEATKKTDRRQYFRLNILLAYESLFCLAY